MQADTAAGVGKFHGISEQIEQHLAQRTGVAMDPRWKSRDAGHAKTELRVLCTHACDFGDIGEQARKLEVVV